MQEPHEAVPQSSPGGLAAFALYAFAFLLPLVFVPDAAFPLQFSKTLLALCAVVVVLVAWSVRTLRSGMLSVGWTSLSSAVVILPFAYLLSSVFSSSHSLSFFGYEIDQDTFGFMALGAALALATALAASSRERIARTLSAFLIGGGVVVAFQLVQVLFHVPFGFGLFSSPIQNLVGKWNDFGLFCSLVASLSLLSFEVLPLSVLRRSILAVLLFVAAALLVVVNLPLAWCLLGVVAFLTLVFSFMRRSAREGDGAGYGARGIASLLVLAAAIFFVLFGNGIAGSLQNHFGISALEVNPSFQGTLGVLEGVYGKDPFFGSGPNTFSHDWFLLRPPQTLSTAFWNAEFNSGFSYVATALATGGIVVGFAWFALICSFLWMAIRALLSGPAGGHSYFLTIATALGAAFLLAAHLSYNPSSSLSLMLFLFLGLCIASVRHTPLSRPVTVAFANNARLAFVCVVLIAGVLIVSLVSLYGAGEVYASSILGGRVVARLDANDVAGALAAATDAVSLSPQDRYFRAIANLQLSKLNTLVQSGASDAKTQSDVENALTAAIAASGDAIAADPGNYDNWMTRAGVYEAAASLSIAGASDNATGALESARKLNPSSPEVDYQEAMLKALAKDAAGAKAAAQAAIAKKADYTPAIFLLAQLSVNEGDLDAAVSSLKSALVFTPDDSSLLYQIGVLELQAKRYQDAADSFSRALAVTPDYADATFFLGEADIFLGKGADALSLFQSLVAQNPDNATLKDVISKLQAGQNPFASAPQTLPPAPATVAQ